MALNTLNIPQYIMDIDGDILLHVAQAHAALQRLNDWIHEIDNETGEDRYKLSMVEKLELYGIIDRAGYSVTEVQEYDDRDTGDWVARHFALYPKSAKEVECPE